ncbi:MAG: class I SAM-dependent methyltransferase [bacterium]
MLDRVTFLATSRKSGLDATALRTLAAWLGVRAIDERPLPADEAGLVLTAEGVRLHVPGGGAGWWPAGLTAQRTARGLADPIVRAVAPRPGLRVLDATLGLGHDALVLARHGVHLDCLEHEAALLFYTAEGLRRHDPRASCALTFRRADHRAWLSSLGDGAVDVVCLDPMFPDPQAPRSATLGLLRQTALRDAVTPATLREASRVARERVVLRLAPGAEPPALAGRTGPIVASQRVRVAVWDRR